MRRPRSGGPVTIRRSRHPVAAVAAVLGGLGATLLTSCAGGDSGSATVSGIVITNASTALIAARGTLESFRTTTWGTTAADSDCWMPVNVDRSAGTASTVNVEVWCGPVATPLNGSGWLTGRESGTAIPDGDGYNYTVGNAPYDLSFSTNPPAIVDGVTILGEGQPAVNSVAPPAPIPVGWVVVDGQRVANVDDLFNNLEQRFAEVRNQTDGAVSQPNSGCWLSDDSQTPNAVCGPIRFGADSDTTPPFIQFPLTFEQQSPSTVRVTIGSNTYNRAQPVGKLIDRTGLHVDPPAIELGATATTTAPTASTEPPVDAPSVTVSAAPPNVPWAEPAGPNRIVWYVKTEAGIDPGGDVTLERWVRTTNIEGSSESAPVDAAPGFELVGADVALVTDVLNDQVKMYLEVDGQQTPLDNDLAETGFIAGVPTSAATVTLAIADGNAVQHFDLRSGQRVNDGNPAWYRETNEIGLLVYTTAPTEVPIASGIESWLTTVITERALLSGFDAMGEQLGAGSSDLVVVGRYESGTAASPSVAVVTNQVDASYKLTLEDGTEITPYAVTGDASRFRAYFHVPATIDKAQLSAQVFSNWKVVDEAAATTGSTGVGAKGEPSVMDLEFGSPDPVK